jgi:serine protease AprX
MIQTLSTCLTRKKAVWGPKRTLAALAVALLGFTPSAMASGQHAKTPPTAKPGVPGSQAKNYKLDGELTKRAARGNPLLTAKVIVELAPGAQLPADFSKYTRGGKLDILNGYALELPENVIRKLAAHPNIFRVHHDREIYTHNYRTGITVGSRFVNDFLGYTGAGIGIAVVDSGVATWHDDLTNKTSKVYPYGNQRVAKFVDFVNGGTLPYDDSGHGTHVAGIIMGNGYDSYGEKSGIAPGASLVSLKVLDANGMGTISRIISALNWIGLNYATYNIRVVNLSVGAPIRESYWTDPLTLAAKKLTDLGITVVAAAGNLGKNGAGQLQYGAITSPGNAPWVLTVGASSTMGTLTRYDDTMAGYSSSGPTAIDFGAKPDLAAPGTGTVSLAAPGSTFYMTKSAFLVSGKLGLGYRPYLTLSGTSMAAPVVSGTVALMLQANPSLTPNLIKAILQYTSQRYPGYNALRQGAGFLNSLGAVRLAKFYANNHVGDKMPTQSVWSRQIIWGNHRLSGGYLNPLGNAWGLNVVWGTARTDGLTGQSVVWGTSCVDATCENVIWGTQDADGENVVWGTSLDTQENVVWGTSFDAQDNVVWGTSLSDSENVVWGTDCSNADCENVVWGTADSENVVWGTADPQDNVLWGTSADMENVVWGTSADADVTWGSSAEDDAAYPDDVDTQPLPSIDLEFGEIVPLIADPTANPTTVSGGF